MLYEIWKNSAFDVIMKNCNMANVVRQQPNVYTNSNSYLNHWFKVNSLFSANLLRQALNDVFEVEEFNSFKKD